MSKAGEEGGTLADTLKIIARQMERSETLTKKVKGAMIYPTISLFAIVVIGILMLIFVVPTLTATFASLGAKLPLSTQVIMALSGFMTHHYIIVLGGLIVLGVGGSIFLRTTVGQKAILFVAMRVPVIGELVQETFSARAARTLSSLLSSGVEMLTALSIAQEVVGDNAFGKVIGEAGERVRKGEALSVAFVNHDKLYPVFMGDMIAVGEETGKVSDMMSQVAEYYENDVEDRTKDLSTIIEPLLMLFIGAFVGVFAVSMIAPIYSLSSSLAG
jgi:type IV pilus assembly protein PilC